MRIQIINGPNINLLGKREPGIYGAESFESYLEKLRTAYPDLEIDYYQSNIEGFPYGIISRIFHTFFWNSEPSGASGGRNSGSFPAK